MADNGCSALRKKIADIVLLSHDSATSADAIIALITPEWERIERKREQAETFLFMAIKEIESMRITDGR